jgi:hypothetical protein
MFSSITNFGAMHGDKAFLKKSCEFSMDDSALKGTILSKTSKEGHQA